MGEIIGLVAVSIPIIFLIGVTKIVLEKMRQKSGSHGDHQKIKELENRIRELEGLTSNHTLEIQKIEQESKFLSKLIADKT
jgi:hypothetical protein